jgi:hypothetical protein
MRPDSWHASCRRIQAKVASRPCRKEGSALAFTLELAMAPRFGLELIAERRMSAEAGKPRDAAVVELGAVRDATARFDRLGLTNPSILPAEQPSRQAFS